MKKISIIFAFSLFSLTLFTGCQSRSGKNTAELENQISQLEQQVTDLKAQQSKSTEPSSPEVSTKPSSDTVTSDTTQQTGSSATQNDRTQNNKTLEELTSLVDAFTRKADTATPSGTASEQRNQFFTLKSELDSIELELDSYDDTLEADFRAGILNANDYHTKENELDRLENRLEKSENTLEFLFGIDD